MFSLKRLSALFVLIFCSVLALHEADPGHASCTVCSPAAPVPSDRWGSLEPRSILADTTYYQFNFEPDCSVPFYFDLAVGQNVLFATSGNAVELWNIGSDPVAPSEKEICEPVLGSWKKSDKDFYIKTVGVVPGDDTIAEKGFTYSRSGNPTVRAFEDKLAKLEGGVDVLAFSTGMAVINAIFMAFLDAGSHAVISDVAYGGTYRLSTQV